MRFRIRHPVRMTHLKFILYKAPTILGAIFFWAWALVKGAVTLIGATTVGDDFTQLLERLPAIAQWLFSTPWWVPSGLAFALRGFSDWGP